MSRHVNEGQIDMRGPRKLSVEQMEVFILAFCRTPYIRIRRMGRELHELRSNLVRCKFSKCA
jgi:hypothetical protein